MASVEVDTVHSDGTSSYDPNNVNEAILMLGSYATAGDEAGKPPPRWRGLFPPGY